MVMIMSDDNNDNEDPIIEHPVVREEHAVDNIVPENRIAILNKGTPALKRKFASGVHLTSMQKKALNAVSFAVQTYAANNFDSIAEFHAMMGEKVMSLNISNSDFSVLTANGSRNLAHMKKMLKELASSQVSWQGTQAKDYGFHNIFLAAGSESSVIYIQIPPATRRAIVSEHTVARIDVIKVAEQLSGTYAISLYENLLAHFEAMGDDIDNITVEYDDEALRHAINVPMKKSTKGESVFSYPGHRKLKERVLVPAADQINEANFEFKIKLDHKLRRGGSPRWIFTITRSEYIRKEIFADSYGHEITMIAKSLHDFGLKNVSSLLKDIQDERSVLYFQFCIDEVKKALDKQKGKAKVNNVAGYFVKAYKSNHEAFEMHYDALKEEQKRRRKQARDDERKNLEHQEVLKKKQAESEIRSARFDNLKPEERDALNTAFELHVSEKYGRSYVDVLRNEGVEGSKLLKAVWGDFLVKYIPVTQKEIEDAVSGMTIKSCYR
jgi:hypothetical protein